MLTIALGQMEVIPGRPDLNTQTMLTMIEEARQKQADIIIFPEMSIPGYLLGDMWEQRVFLQDCEEYGRLITAASQGICTIFGNVAIDWEKHGDDGRVRKYNALFVASDGQLQGGDNFPYPFRIKTLHPNYREFDDSRHFYSLRKLAVEKHEHLETLLTPVTLTLKGKALSLACILCEDGWSDDYAVNPLEVICKHNAVDLLVNISSSPFTLGKNNKRNRVFSKQAADVKVPLIYVNTVGIQNNGKTIYTFDGSSTVYAANGEIVDCAPAFAAELRFLTLPLSKEPTTASSLGTADTDNRSIYQALRYGISHFLQTTGIKKVVIGASGGIDSAVSAALYVDILGPENVLLVNMPSVYNSQTTKDLAEQLAHNLACHYTVFPIQTMVDYTINQLETTPIINLQTGESFQLPVSRFTAENIQARDRSSRILAGIAAAFGGAFTCNANKSELTVGYSTLYGDLGGFLAALADLWKHQVYELAHYLNDQVYAREVIPYDTITIVPSAELSPDQAVDEGKGDPITYPYHDYLFRSFMEFWNRSTPEDILTWYSEGVLETKLGCKLGLVSQLFASPQDFITDLEKWWRLYSGMAVAKRIQAPPVLAISRRAYGFDHREAQNMPYFSIGYKRLKDKLLADS